MVHKLLVLFVKKVLRQYVLVKNSTTTNMYPVKSKSYFSYTLLHQGLAAFSNLVDLSRAFSNFYFKKGMILHILFCNLLFFPLNFLEHPPTSVYTGFHAIISLFPSSQTFNLDGTWIFPYPGSVFRGYIAQSKILN